MPPSPTIPRTSTAWVEEDDFSAGIFPDVAPHKIRPGGTYDAVDMLVDRTGKIRKRGGTTTSGVTSTTAFATLFGRLATAYGTTTLYGARPSGNAYSIVGDGNTAMGTIIRASVTGIGSNAGRPFEHLGFMIFPSQTPGSASGTISAAGGTFASADFSFIVPANIVITAGDPKITTDAGDVALTSGHVGMMIEIQNASTHYLGRIDRVISGHAFTVFPRPTVTITTPTAAALRLFYGGFYGYVGAKTIGGKVGCSHQGRILLGNIVYTKASKEAEAYPYRVYYSILPDEIPSVNGATTGQFGAAYLVGDGFEDNNYFDVPSLEPIVALQPFGENQVLILGPTKAHRLTGQLLTQTSTRSGITYDVHPIPNSVGCISELSVQVSERGVIWANKDGVYISDGSSVKAMMDGALSQYWRDQFYGTSALVVGSAIVRNHYLVCTNGYHFLCNLTTLAWTRLSGAGARVFYSVSDAVDPSKILGLLFWSGSAPTHAKGSLVRLDSMFVPASTNQADADGTTVSGILVTRSYSAGDPERIKNFTRAQAQYDARSGTPTLDRTVVSPADAVWSNLGTLPATTARSDYTFGMGAASVQRGYSAAYRLITGACDSCDVYALKSAYQAGDDGASS